MTPVLALREWVSKLDGIHPLPVALNLDIDKLNHHFDLLQTFLGLCRRRCPGVEQPNAFTRTAIGSFLT